VSDPPQSDAQLGAANRATGGRALGVAPNRRSRTVRPRGVLRVYQMAARIWLTAAALSLLLPRAVRLDWWVPLHLMLVGAVSVAISGAMQNFVAALTASGPAPAPMVWAQFALVNVGAALTVAGRSSGRTSLVGAGGTAFIAGMVLLGLIVSRAWRRALHLRHRVPVAMYGAAVICVLAGASIGIVLATGAVQGAKAWLDLRTAHLVLNVLGWVSLTIAGTLITLLPTVLRVRMPAWGGRVTVWLFVVGIGTMALGVAMGRSPLAAAGAAAYGFGVAGVVLMATRALSIRRKWPVPLSAKHLLLALAWFTAGTVWTFVALLRGVEWFAGADDVLVIVFGGGWILQTLLGAWLYLLPVMRPAHPDKRRRMLVAVEWGGGVELLALNSGLVMLAIAAAGTGFSTLATTGAALALTGATIPLVKAWTYPLLGRLVSREPADVGRRRYS
jgi:nitrite reductase (NO-forming)